MQRLLETHRSFWNSLGLHTAIVLLAFLGWLPPTNAGTGPKEQRTNQAQEVSDRPQPKKAAPRFRKISARKLPLELLEEFRKNYPAAVELEWQSRDAHSTEVMDLQPPSTNEKLLIPRLDTKIYRVQGYNLGQFFTATYLNNRRQSHAILEKCEDLASALKSSWQSSYPDWKCLAFTRILTNEKELQHRILITLPTRYQTRILSIDSNGKPQAIDHVKQWGRIRYTKIKNESLRLRLLITTP